MRPITNALDKTQDVDLSSYHHPQGKGCSNAPSGSGTNAGTLEDKNNVVVVEEDEDEDTTQGHKVQYNMDPKEQDVSDHEMSKSENGQSPNSLAKVRDRRRIQKERGEDWFMSLFLP